MTEMTIVSVSYDHLTEEDYLLLCEDSTMPHEEQSFLSWSNSGGSEYDGVILRIEEDCRCQSYEEFLEQFGSNWSEGMYNFHRYFVQRSVDYVKISSTGEIMVDLKTYEEGH